MARLIAVIAALVLVVSIPHTASAQNNGDSMKQLKDCAKKGGTC